MPLFRDGYNVKQRSRRSVATLRLLTRQPVALVSSVVILGWVVLGLIAPWLPVDDPNRVAIEEALRPPGAGRPLGTDELGRDVLSRVLHAARISVPAGLLVVGGSLVLGAAIGAVSGLVAGSVDQVVMRICDAVLAFPALVLAMAVSAARGGPGLDNAVIAVVIVLWPEYARLTRGQVLVLREQGYVVAARATGASPVRLLLRHILPGTTGPMIVKATLDTGAAILLIASLSFLGFGAVPPTAEWGSMVSQGARIGLQFWWCSAFPGLAIMSLVMALNFFGDSVSNALDPRSGIKR
jgi:peptide/nickel transport system permease protein